MQLFVQQLSFVTRSNLKINNNIFNLTLVNQVYIQYIRTAKGRNTAVFSAQKN